MPAKRAKRDATVTAVPPERCCVERLPEARAFALANGVSLPAIGFGTYKLKGPETGKAVRMAIDAGYRLVDTAHVYGGGKTEGFIGKVLKGQGGRNKTASQSSTARSKRPRPSKEAAAVSGESNDGGLFITTKVWRGSHGYAETTACLNTSLRRLGVDKVDLVLMHWPGPGYSAMGRSKERIRREGIKCYFKKGHEDVASLRLETWRALEDAHLSGKCRAIGVSNFTVSHLKHLLGWEGLRVSPVVNQVEMHPYYPQTELRAFCRDHDICIQAYASLGGQDTSSAQWDRLGIPPLLQQPAVLRAAEAHGKPAASVLLRWALQQGVAVIPKTRDQARVVSNLQAASSFSLTEEEMAALDGLDQGPKGRLCWRRDELRMLHFE